MLTKTKNNIVLVRVEYGRMGRGEGRKENKSVKKTFLVLVMKICLTL